MTLTRRRAWLAALIWAVAALAFSLSFFGSGGPAEYAVESTRILVGAITLGLAGMLHAWIVLRTRPSAGAGNITDERDLAVVARAGQTALLIVLVGVLGSSVTLWVVYRSAGHVPVGWMWYLGYGTVILAFLAHALCTVVVDSGMGGNERD